MQRTELQVLMRGLSALQLEIRAVTLAVRSPDFVKAEMHKLQSTAKELMQSAVEDANMMALRDRVVDEDPEPSKEVEIEPLFDLTGRL